MEMRGPGGTNTAHVLREEPWCCLMSGKEEETAWYPCPREKREMLGNVECLVQNVSRDQMSCHVIRSVLCALSGGCPAG